MRLSQGDYDRESVYNTDPVRQATEFAAAGASWIHVVDLDAARSGEPENRETVAAIAAAVDVPVQAGGGVRSAAAALELLDSGVERIVIGTAALEHPRLVESLASSHRIAVGLDARDGELASHGWTRNSRRGLTEVIGDFENAGVDAFVVTDIARDGMLSGPDLVGLQVLLETTAVEIVASGGIASLSDLEALAALACGQRRLSGAIVGKALYEKSFSIADAVALLESGRS